MMRNKQYKAIFFDLDGTITDPKIGITKSVQKGLQKFGKGVGSLDELKIYIGPPLRYSFVEYGGLTPEQAEEAVKEYRAYYGEAGIFEASIYDGIPELLEGLNKAGFMVVLATSKPQIYAERILEHFGIAGQFFYVAGSELSSARNEKWEVIDYALQALNLDPGAVLMVGDRMHDIDGAHKCGIKCVGVLYGYGSQSEFEAHHADYIVNTVKDLGELLLE